MDFSYENEWYIKGEIVTVSPNDNFFQHNFLFQDQDIPYQGGNSQNFLRKFVRFFLTLKCFYGKENRYFMIYTVVSITL